MIVNVLGQEYKIIYTDELDDSLAGQCDFYSKEIFINNIVKAEGVEYENETIRHEILHAFLFESGLNGCSEFARNEEMIDYFAIQIPKIMRVYDKLGLL